MSGERGALTQHTGGDIHPDPHMPILIQHLSAQTASAPDIKDEARLVLGYREKLERAGRHFRLDVLNTRATSRQRYASNLKTDQRGQTNFLVYFLDSVSP